MYVIKEELKFNTFEVTYLRGIPGLNCLGYNYELKLLTSSWNFDNIFKSDSPRIDAIKKLFTKITRQKSKYAWIKQYPSIGYQSAVSDFEFAVFRWLLCLSKLPVKKTQKK